MKLIIALAFLATMAAATPNQGATLISSQPIFQKQEDLPVLDPRKHPIAFSFLLFVVVVLPVLAILALIYLIGTLACKSARFIRKRIERHARAKKLKAEAFKLLTDYITELWPEDIQLEEVVIEKNERTTATGPTAGANIDSADGIELGEVVIEG